MTKLFQSKDVTLRRLVYLGIKELAGVADDVIIVTSSLTKDMTGKEDLYRAAAIRALCCITDVRHTRVLLLSRRCRWCQISESIQYRQLICISNSFALVINAL